MEWSSWNFHLVKQLVTQNVRINFLPSQARNTKFRDYDKSGRHSWLTAVWGLQKNDLLTVYRVYTGF